MLSIISEKIRTALSANLLLKSILSSLSYLAWDINHKIQTPVFHFKLIHPRNYSQISLLVTFIKRFVRQSQQSLFFTKTFLFPHKTAYFLNNSQNAHKNTDDNSKFYTINLNPWKSTFSKQLGIAKDEIKVNVILVNKSMMKAKDFIMPVLFYRN